MIKIHFEAESWAVLKEQIQEFAVAHLHAKFGDMKLENGAVQPADRAPGGHSDKGIPEQETAPAPRKPRAKKATAAEVKTAREENPDLGMHEAKAQVEAAQPAHIDGAPDAPAPAKAPSLDDCTGALQKVWDKHGMEKSIECLNRFGAKRARELDPKVYGEFIALCEQTAAG